MKNLTLRSILAGIAGLVVVTASSMYVALRLGALPWPTVFVTVLAMTVLSKFRDSTINEINVCHTLMSAGAMIAGGLAFTLPGIWMINSEASLSFASVLAITIAGTIIGTVFSAVYRPTLMTNPNLVFPIGHAAYDTLVAGLSKGKKALKLFGSMAVSAVFTILRDTLGIIPSVITLFRGSATVEPVTIWLSTMALGIGAILDKFSCALWFLGMVLGYFILPPITLSTGVFADFAACSLFRQNLGIGIMLGSGVGLLIRSISRKKDHSESETKLYSKKALSVSASAMVIVSAALSLFTDIGFFEALVACAAIACVSLVSGVLTGQSGINPMEIFAMMVTLLVAFLFKSSQTAMFLTAGMVAVSCGLTGDVMNDFKSGYMLGTDAKSQIAAEAIGGIAGSFVAVASLFVMKSSFGAFGTSELPAPQAAAVAAMLGGFSQPAVLLTGGIVGIAVTVFGVSAATLGLGIYISPMITIPVCIGNAIAFLCMKSKKIENEDISLVASGLLGGEGVTGVVTAIISMFA